VKRVLNEADMVSEIRREEGAGAVKMQRFCFFRVAGPCLASDTLFGNE
jgi:hypothetical protein